MYISEQAKLSGETVFRIAFDTIDSNYDKGISRWQSLLLRLTILSMKSSNDRMLLTSRITVQVVRWFLLIGIMNSTNTMVVSVNTETWVQHLKV